MQSYIQSQEKEKFQVVAIALEEEPAEWLKLKIKYPEFIHVYGDGKWDNAIGNSYGITITPTYFVLDKDKIIAAKPKSFKALKLHFKSKE